MRILFLSQRFVLPMDTGGKIRTGKILEQLNKDHELTVISNVESPVDDAYIAEMEGMCTKFIPVYWKEVKKYSVSFFLRLFFQTFSIYPVTVLNTCSEPLQKTLEREAINGNFDIAICDFVQSALIFKNIKDIPLVLFQHNVESVISKRHMEQTVNPIAKLFWWLQWVKLYRYESQQSKLFDAVIAVSKNDAEFFQNHYDLKCVYDIPTGVDVEYFKPREKTEVNKYLLTFCGSMDWLPNEDGIMYFIDEILPILKRKIPGIHLTVVGRNPSPQLEKAAANMSEIDLTGWVDDTRKYIANSALFIVPLRIGGGTRMKIYEAMAMGEAVISTTIGAEGLPVTHGENIIIEDDSLRFAEVIIELLMDDKKRIAIGVSANKFVTENYSWKQVADRFTYICEIAAQKESKILPATEDAV